MWISSACSIRQSLHLPITSRSYPPFPKTVFTSASHMCISSACSTKDSLYICQSQVYLIHLFQRQSLHLPITCVSHLPVPTKTVFTSVNHKWISSAFSKDSLYICQSHVDLICLFHQRQSLNLSITSGSHLPVPSKTVYTSANHIWITFPSSTGISLYILCKETLFTKGNPNCGHCSMYFTDRSPRSSKNHYGWGGRRKVHQGWGWRGGGLQSSPCRGIFPLWHMPTPQKRMYLNSNEKCSWKPLGPDPKGCLDGTSQAHRQQAKYVTPWK